MLEFLQTNAVELITILLAIHTAAVHIAKFTKTTVDDEAVNFVGKVINFLAASFIKPKA